MKLPLRHSFRGKLFSVLLWTTLIPLIGCSVLLIVIFKARMSENAQNEANTYMETVSLSYTSLCGEISSAAKAVGSDELITNALSGIHVSSRMIYERLFKVTENLRSHAQIDLYDSDGQWVYTTGSKPTSQTLATDWGILYAAQRDTNETVFRSGESYGAADSSAAALQAAKAILSPVGRTIGYTVVTMNAKDIEGLFSGKFGTQNVLLLLDAHWRIVYASKSSGAEELASRLRSDLLRGSLTGSDAYSYVTYRDGATGFFLILQQPQVITKSTMRLLYTVSATVALLCICVCVLVSLRMSRYMFEPIDQLRRAFGELEEGNTEVRVEMRRSDELGLLALSFNHMVEKLKDYMERMVRGQRELDETQIRMMQSQLNPHFLCNTLDTMKWMGKIHNVPEISEMSTDLADILRTSISSDEFVDLATELKLLQRYVDIQRIRFPGKFEYVQNVPKEFEDCVIPKLILQPLVENAVLHGLEDRESGVIRISAEEKSMGELHITVSDNGCGIDSDTLDKLNNEALERPEGHLGLYNVNMILKKYYGGRCGLKFKNLPEGGAAVSAVLPVRRKA